MQILKAVIDSAKYLVKNLNKKVYVDSIIDDSFNYSGFRITNVIEIHESEIKKYWKATDLECIKLTASTLQEIIKKIDNFS